MKTFRTYLVVLYLVALGIASGGTTSVFAQTSQAQNGAHDGIRYWTLPNTTNGLDPKQSWSGAMVAPDGSVYIAGMDHTSNAALYRMKNNVLQYVGDAKSASQAQNNWRADDAVEKFHTRPYWFGGKVYVATMNQSDLSDAYLTTPTGIRIYSFDPATNTFSDLSATKPDGEEAKGSIVSFTGDTSRGVLYGNMPPTGDIYRYTPSSKLFEKLGRPSAFSIPYVYPSRFMWVGSDGTLYFSAGSKPSGSITYDPNVFSYVYAYNPTTNSFTKKNWQLNERAIDFGQCHNGTCYLMDNGGSIYRYTDSGPSFSFLGRATSSVDVRSAHHTWVFSVDFSTLKAYVVTRFGVLYEFDLQSRVSTKIANLPDIESVLADIHNQPVFNTYGYDAMGADGTFYFAAFGPDASTDNVVLVGINPQQLKTDLGISGGTPTAQLSVSPTTRTGAGSVTLTWSSTNAASCTAGGGWSGTKAASGSQTLSISSTQTFTITCAGITRSATVAVQPAGASGNTSCNLYASGTNPPSGYAASWDVFSSARELLVKTSCPSSGTNLTLTVGKGDTAQAVYNMAYTYNGSWQPHTLTGTYFNGSTVWLTGMGTQEIVAPQTASANAPFYFVGYVCTNRSGSWKCGCADSACATGKWQLQAYTGIPNGGTTAGGGTGGSYSGSRTFTPVAWPTSGTNGEYPLGGVMYGNPLSGEGAFAPRRVGQGNNTISFRFRAERSGVVDAVDWEMRVSRKCLDPSTMSQSNSSECDAPGEYHTGDGGLVTLELREDANGIPGALVASTEQFTPVVFENYNPARTCTPGTECSVCFEPNAPYTQRPILPTYQTAQEACVPGDKVVRFYGAGGTDENQIQEFVTPPTVVAGRHYHLVMRNAHPSYYVEVNSALVGEPGPWLDDWRMLLGSGTWNGSGGTWSELDRYSDFRNVYLLPIMRLKYQGGPWVGNGGTVAIATNVEVRPTTQIDQRFDLGTRTIRATGVWVRVARTGPSTQAPLTVTLEDAQGAALYTGILAASNVVEYVSRTVYPKWYYLPFPSPITIGPNTVHVIFSSQGTYRIGARNDAYVESNEDRNKLKNVQSVWSKSTTGSWTLMRASNTYNVATGVLFTIEGMPTSL
jgi:hypothetical protein